jgi:hypothetical protein
MNQNILTGFLKDLNALKYYVDSVEPIVKPSKQILSDNIGGLILKTYLYQKSNKSIEKINNISDEFLETFKYFDECITIVNEENNKVTFTYNNDKRIEKAIKEMHFINSLNLQKNILYRGSLINLVVFFESLISQLFKEDFNNHPNRMCIDKKSITYEKISLLYDIKDVKPYLIEREITEIIREDSEKWFELFKKNMKVKLIFLHKFQDDLTEIIKRRNLFVHNNGIINSFYINSVPLKYKENLVKGMTLDVDRTYIDNAINTIEYIGVLLSVEIWIHEMNDKTKETELIFNFITDEFLFKEKWELSLKLYELFLTIKKLEPIDLIVAKINKWLCYKRLGKYDEIIDEITPIDINAFEEIHIQLGLLALQNNVNEFMRIYKTQTKLNNSHIEKWPIFEEIRQSQQYKEYLDSQTEEN